MCMHACQYVCVYVCVCVSMCVCMYSSLVALLPMPLRPPAACLYVCMYVCMYACTYACVYVCNHACMYECMIVCMYVCMHACVYASMYACMHACCMRVYKTINKERPFGHSTYRASAHSRLCHMRWHDMITSRHTMSYDYIKAHHVIWLHQGIVSYEIASRLCHQGYVIKAMYIMSSRLCTPCHMRWHHMITSRPCHQGYVHHVIKAMYIMSSEITTRLRHMGLHLSVCTDIQMPQR